MTVQVRGARRSGTVDEDEVVTTRSICRVCHAACPIEVDVAAGRVTKIRGVDADPLFEGYTCIKGRQLPDQIHHPDRLVRPLRRRPDGTFEEIDPATALDEIAERMRAILDRGGPRAVASYTGTGGYQNSVAVETARAWHKGLGSPSFYTSVTIDQPAKTTAPARMGTWEAGFHNFSDADVIMAIGYNPMVSSYGAVGGLQGTNPFTVMRRAKERGMHLVVVDPRRSELSTFADVHLQVRPGEDPTLLAAMLRIVLAEDLFDDAFCERWVDGLDRLADAVEPFTVEVAAARCEIDRDDLVAATHLFAAGPRGTVGTGTGPNMAPHSGLTEHLALALNVVCGRVNQEGDRLESGWFLYPGTPRRAQVLAPKDPQSGAPHRFRGLTGYRGEMLSTVLAEEILEPGDGRVRALVVSGGNPAVAFPDQQLTMRALRDLELLVVVDHRMTATAAEADYVLPPRLSLERADVPHLMDRWFAQPYTNYTDAVVEAPEGCLNEWEVFHGLARRLGSTIRLAGGDLAAVEAPSDGDVIDLQYAAARMPIEEVRRRRNEVHPELALVVEAADPGATARFDLTPPGIGDELAEVASERTGAEAVVGVDADQYPFRLVSRRLKSVLNSLGPELPGLARKGTTNPAYLHPEDLAELGVDTGDLVEITSAAGRLVGVCEAAPDIKRGVVSMAHSWGDGSLRDDRVRDIGVPTSRLTSTTMGHDPITGMAVLSAIPVQVRAAAAEPGPDADPDAAGALQPVAGRG